MRRRFLPSPHHEHAEEEDHEEHKQLDDTHRCLPAAVLDDEYRDPEDRGGNHRGPKRDPNRSEEFHSASTGSWLAGGRASRSGGRKVKASSWAAPSPLVSTRTVPPPWLSLPNSTSSASGFFRYSWMPRASGRAPNRRS